MSPRVIGLDPSLSGTGLAAASGTDRIRTDLRGCARLARIKNDVIDWVSGANLVVIEGPSYGSMSGAGHHESAGLWWLLAYTLEGLSVPYAVVPPTTLKKYATGSGKATKPDMRVALLQRTGVDLRDDNEVDAAWLRMAGLDHLGHPVVDLPKAQREALAKVSWPETAVAR